MLIFNDVSMFSAAEIKLLDKNLRILKNDFSTIYGGLDVIFVGDFCQLLPVARKPIYDDNCPEFTASINCYIHLQWQHQFQSDISLRGICQRFYNGYPRIDDFSILNRHIIPSVDSLPPNFTAICTNTDEQDNINSSSWLKHLSKYGETEGLVIFADKLYSHHKTNTYCYNKKCTEMLLCYPGSPQMLTINYDMLNNLTNGIQGYFVNIVLK
jgi:hypothetical protein